MDRASGTGRPKLQWLSTFVVQAQYDIVLSSRSQEENLQGGEGGGSVIGRVGDLGGRGGGGRWGVGDGGEGGR